MSNCLHCEGPLRPWKGGKLLGYTSGRGYGFLGDGLFCRARCSSAYFAAARRISAGAR